MKSTSIVNLLVLVLLGSVVYANSSLAEMDTVRTCETAQEYFLVAVTHHKENGFRKSFDFDSLTHAAACSVEAGDSALAIEQYKFITSIENDDPTAWSELVFLQLDQIVDTLKGIIRNSPPRNDEERAIVTQIMALMEAYGSFHEQQQEAEAYVSLDEQRQEVEAYISLDERREDISTEPVIETSSISRESQDLWDSIAQEIKWINESEIPGTQNQIRRYLSERNYFNVISRRAGKYLGFIVSEIRQRELPIELALIPIIESSLNPAAVSPRKAAGLWQIMPATANQYRLTRNRWYDERFDIRTSTNLALNHLTKLNKKFSGNWLLTLSAYNSGSARIQKLLANQSDEKDWIDLIPNETRQYLARVFALSTILADPESFGLQLPKVDQREAFVVVGTDGRIELPLAAALSDLTLSTLRAYNPGYMRWAIPRRGYQELLLPPSNAEIFRTNLANLSREQRMAGETYTVKAGDSLGKIANRLEVKLSTLRSINNVRRNMLWAGEKLLVPGTSFVPD